MYIYDALKFEFKSNEHSRTKMANLIVNSTYSHWLGIEPIDTRRVIFVIFVSQDVFEIL
jgi:hypothetical protein